MARTVCLLGTSPEAKGGIGTVVASFLNDISVEGYVFEYVMTHKDVGTLGKIATGLRGYVEFRRLLAKGNIDLVHMHTSFGASFMRSIPFIETAHRAGVPIVNHCHVGSWDAFYGAASDTRRRWISEVYGKCDRIIALSEDWLGILNGVIPMSKLTLLENCVPSVEYREHSPVKSENILFLGRLDQNKGCDYLLDVCEAVLRSVPSATFDICGDGPMADAMRREVEQRGLSSRVRFMGWVSGEVKSEAFCRSRVFLLTSYSEGMPMCILEAMGAGLPVVATQVGGIPQIVMQGTNGFLCEPGDIEGLSSALAKILTDDVLCESMSKASKLVASGHSPTAYSSRLKEIYDEVIESHGVDRF